MGNRIDITKNNFFAWSLYTAYQDAKTVGNWVAAKWPGKTIEKEQDLKEDIDFRIEMYIKAFKVAIEASFKCNDKTCYFVVPEFYFHSTHGPYPGLEIEEKSVFEYIMETLSSQIKSILAKSAESNRDWVICSGGVLTTHITDISGFLQTQEVKERLDRLNEFYMKANQNEEHKRTSHIGSMRLKSHETSSNEDKYTELNELVNLYRKDPLCSVRNRAGILVYNSDTKDISTYSIEKQAESFVDLTLGVIKEGKIDTGEQITEWIANYPPVSILNGDNQGNGSGLSRDSGARMPISLSGESIELGAEICLDHYLQRLRRTVNMVGNAPLDVQLVPSGGIQLFDFSIAGGNSGAIFNADGCDPIINELNDKAEYAIQKDGNPCSGSIKEVTTGVYCSSTQTLSKGIDGHSYFSHSQLAYRTNTTGPDDYINPKNTDNMGGITFTGDSSDPSNEYLDLFSVPKVYKVDYTDFKFKVDQYFTAGLGEIHQYSVPIDK